MSETFLIISIVIGLSLSAGFTIGWVFGILEGRNREAEDMKREYNRRRYGIEKRGGVR